MPPQNKDMFQFCVSAPIDELLHQCGSALTQVLNTSKIDELTDLSNTLNTLSNIVKLSKIMIESNIPSQYLELCKANDLSYKNAALMVLTEYTNLSQLELLDFLNKTAVIGDDLWKPYAENPDNITSEMLDKFYNDCGEHHLYLERYYTSMVVHLGPAVRGFIANFAKQIGGKCFDFGGGIGNLTSAISNLGHDNVYLIETDNRQLDFVKWKDEKCGIKNINYIGSDEIANFFEMKETFQFGVALELLEHVMNPPELMESLASLIAPNGYLFLSSSFHVYPHPGHLKSNVQYTDKEDEILKPFGMIRVHFDNPGLPFLFNWKLFQKIN